MLEKLSRNREWKCWLLFYLVTAAAAATLGAFLLGKRGGLCLLGLGLFLGGVHLVSLSRRYRSMLRLSEEIDQVLHGREALSFSSYEEGELAILKNELDKLLIRLREQNAQLRGERRYLESWVTDISHQIRTPLTTLHLVSDRLSREEVPQKRRELVHELQRQLGRMDWLISALLKLARLDAGTVTFQRERVSVCELLKKAREPLTIPMELKGVQLIASCSAEGFFGDLHWSAEALGNLLKNCLEHTPSGGSIWISCEENPIYTEITVTDSGRGIEAEELPHLFERFYRGKYATVNGIGIGLALARMILIRQNGTLTAENAPEGGARFRLRYYRETV